jgi:transposase
MPESVPGAGYDGAKRKRDSKLHIAVDTLGHLLALHVTPAGKLAGAMQQATGDTVELIAARAEGIELCVVELDEAKRGFVLLPKRWVVEHSFG